ncbi:hypothetical protein ASD00_27135 [Ensifer sp. Root31]|nr:hypothetical protein ASD00_27135 [Ensifer sp. Root31]
MANKSQDEAGPSAELLDPKLLERLPPEVVEQIGTHMVTNDIRATARGLNYLKMFSPYARAVTETSPQLKRVQTRIHDLRSLSNDHHAAVVKEELPPVGSETYGAPRESEPVPAEDYVRAVGPNLKLRSSEEKSALVTKILAIPDGVARSETIRAMTPYFDDIAKDDRSRLIKDAINTFGDRGHPLTEDDFKAFGEEGYSINIEGRHEAADVIVESQARGDLTEEHQTDISDLKNSWPELKGLLAEREKIRRESISTRIGVSGPDAVAADVLNSNNDAWKAIQTSQLTRYFNEIDPDTRSGLIDHAITTFGQTGEPLESGGRSEAVDVIVEARAGGYLTEDHKESLNSFTRDSPELKEVLSERTKSNKKYMIDQASDAEISNLRKTFKEVENMDVPPLDAARFPAEHARMESLQRVSDSVAKSSAMLRNELRDANRDRSNRVR